MSIEPSAAAAASTAVTAQPVYHFCEPRELHSLFVNPYLSGSFLDAWLSAIATYLRSLSNNALSNRVWGMGDVYLEHLEKAIGTPRWEHKVLFILVYLNTHLDARAKLRTADQEFMEREFQQQYIRVLWGRTPFDQRYGFAPGQVADTSQSVLRSFIHNLINVYLIKGYDLK